MDRRTIFGTILLSTAMLIALVTLVRAMFYTPTLEDIGLRPTHYENRPDPTLTTDTKIKAGFPKYLRIPEININANIQYVGVARSGNMAVPTNYTDVGWYKYGTLPGEKGSAVMAGHVDNSLGMDGVFKHLDELEPGDDVYVERGDGTKLHYKVVRKDIYPYNAGPVAEIFSRDDDEWLNLITCTGEWVPEARTNSLRLVIFTKLVS